MKAFIFDLDGTLVDTEPLNDKHTDYLLRKLSAKPRLLSRSLRGLNAKETWTVLSEEYGLHQSIDELILIGRQSYIDYLSSQKFIPTTKGSLDLVQHLFERGFPLAIASSANPKRIELLLDLSGMSQYFSTIVSGDDVKRSKPAPDSYLLAAIKLGVDPKECIAFEDATNGICAAKKAKMYCIAYSSSSNTTENLAQADLIVSDLRDVIPILGKI